MPKPQIPQDVPAKVPPEGRDKLEIIRFPTEAAQIRAIGVLMDRGMLNFSANRQDAWYVRTPVARKLRELGVPFEWVTEHV